MKLILPYIGKESIKDRFRILAMPEGELTLYEFNNAIQLFIKFLDHTCNLTYFFSTTRVV